MTKIKLLSYFFLASLLIVSFQNCQFPTDKKGTETGDPSFNMQVSSFTQSTAMDYFIPKAFAAVSGVRLCIHQIRFKADNSSATPGLNANIEVGYIELDPTGTDLGNIQVTPGDYRRIDIMVKNECNESLSIEIDNDNGSFVVDNPKTLRFIGEITVDEEAEGVVLNIVPLINFFDTVNSDSDLNSGVENIDGTF